jgi:hypothetical protein
MRVTQFETIFGRINVDTIDHPRWRYRASFENVDTGPYSTFGWVNCGWTINDAVTGLLTDHSELMMQMTEGLGQSQH